MAHCVRIAADTSTKVPSGRLDAGFEGLLISAAAAGIHAVVYSMPVDGRPPRSGRAKRGTMGQARSRGRRRLSRFAMRPPTSRRRHTSRRFPQSANRAVSAANTALAHRPSGRPNSFAGKQRRQGNGRAVDVARRLPGRHARPADPQRARWTFRRFRRNFIGRADLIRVASVVREGLCHAAPESARIHRLWPRVPQGSRGGLGRHGFPGLMAGVDHVIGRASPIRRRWPSWAGVTAAI